MSRVRSQGLYWGQPASDGPVFGVGGLGGVCLLQHLPTVRPPHRVPADLPLTFTPSPSLSRQHPAD